jgi:hypothetical protein
MVFRSHSIDARDDSITHALIVIHGMRRDADNYYRYALAAGTLANALGKTLIIAPRFAANDARHCQDAIGKDEINWMCRGPARWPSGGGALSRDDMTSFDVLDEILRRLARRDIFPMLKTVVLAGHSAGGQYVTRYEFSNNVHEKLPFSLSYVVSNPSSYTYPGNLRPVENHCAGYNAWPYGFERRVGYTAKISEETLIHRLTNRPVIYLLGELDTLPRRGFDRSCPAMAQGPTRLARGLAYAKYVNGNLGARHRVITVPACGHDAHCMFNAEAALPALFPED